MMTMRPPPDQQRGRGIEHRRDIPVICGFVDNHLALQAAQVRRVAGQRYDLEAAGVANAVGVDLAGVAGVVLVLEQELLDLTDTGSLGLGDHAGELGAVADELQAFLFRVADIEHVHAASAAA